MNSTCLVKKTPVDYKFLHQFSTASELEVLSARLKRKNKSDVFQAEQQSELFSFLVLVAVISHLCVCHTIKITIYFYITLLLGFPITSSFFCEYF